MLPLIRRALFAAAIVCAGASSARVEATPIDARTAGAWQRIDQDQARFHGAQLTPANRNVTRTGKTKRTFSALIKGTKEQVFVRLPRQGIPVAMRRHNAMRVLADQLERADLIPAAGALTLGEDIGNGKIAIGDAVRTVSKGTQVMVVDDVGAEYVPYKDFMEAGDTTAAAHFDETTRVQVALLHLLTRQLDANSTNVLVRRKDGNIKLIDFDVSLGIKHTGKEIRGSVFFPGRPLGYTGAQNRYEDLPKKAQRLVRRLAEAPLPELARALRLEPDEAKTLQAMAVSVKTVGLTRAIQAFKREYPTLFAPKEGTP
jgi:hypothetical protein